MRSSKLRSFRCRQLAAHRLSRARRIRARGPKASWQLVLSLLGLISWPALRVHAEAPLRVALRVASDNDRALLPRLRGQLSDTNTQLSVVETAPLEAALADQVARANALANEHDADALVWCTSAQPQASAPRHRVHILLARSDRILTRELTSATHGPFSSSELETAALLVRSAMIALAQNTELGQPTAALLAANSGSRAPQDPPSRNDAADTPPPAASAPGANNEASVAASTADSLPRAAAQDSPQRDKGSRGATSEGAPPTAAAYRLSPRESSTRSADQDAVETERVGAGDEVAPEPALSADGEVNGPTGWTAGSSFGSAAPAVDTAKPEPSGDSRAAPAPLRARLALGAQLAVDGQSRGGQRGLFASAGLGFGGWALSVFGVVSLAAELADEYFALNVARHAVGISVERQLPLSDAWALGLAAHGGALLLRRTSQAKSDAVVSYPASLIAAFAFGPELALSWLRGRFGVALRVGLDVLPAAPRFESAGSSLQHAGIAHPLWTVQPRVALGWEAALP